MKEPGNPYDTFTVATVWKPGNAHTLLNTCLAVISTICSSFIWSGVSIVCIVTSWGADNWI